MVRFHVGGVLEAFLFLFVSRENASRDDEVAGADDIVSVAGREVWDGSIASVDIHRT